MAKMCFRHVLSQLGGYRLYWLCTVQPPVHTVAAAQNIVRAHIYSPQSTVLYVYMKILAVLYAEMERLWRYHIFTRNAAIPSEIMGLERPTYIEKQTLGQVKGSQILTSVLGPDAEPQ